MAKVVKRKPSEVKDALLEHISRDIKALQMQQCDVNAIVDAVHSENKEAQNICEHLEQVLMHGLYRSDVGYWPFVSSFTRRDAVRSLKTLQNVKTSIGRGRAWLMLALNEQSLESYLRIFLENQETVLEYYTMEAFLRDCERMTLLITLVTGLEFLLFELTTDANYLDFAPSAYMEYGVPHVRGTDLSIQPSFVSAVTLESSRKQASTLHGTEQQATPTILSESRSGPLLKQSLPSVVMSDGAVVTLESPAQQSPTILDRFSQVESNVLVQPQRKSKGKRKKKKTHSNEGREKSRQFEDSVRSVESSEGVYVSSDKQETHSQHRNGPDVKSSANKAAAVTPDTESSFEGPSWSVRPGSESPFGGQTGSSFEAQTGPPWTRGHKPEIQTVSSASGASSPHLNAGVPLTNSPALLVNKSPLDSDVQASATGEASTTEEPDLPLSTRTDPSDAVEHPKSSQEPREDVCAGPDQSASSLPKCDASMPPGERPSEHSPGGGGNDDNSVAKEGSSTTPEPSGGDNPAPVLDSGRGHSEATSAVQKLAEDYSIIESEGKMSLEEPESLTVTGESSKLLFFLRKRPVLNEVEGHRADMPVSDNIRLILSLEVFFNAEESIHRVVKVRIPIGLGRYQLAALAITNAAVYITQCDDVQGEFSRIVGMAYPGIAEVIVGQSWQLLELVYSEEKEGYPRKPCRQVIVTGNEAVSRSISKSIRITASEARPYRVNIPIIKDEGRGAMMSLELAKLSSTEPQAEILRYSLVHWEQLMGEPPKVDSPEKDRDTLSGGLLVKESSLFGKGWKSAYFSLIDGILHHYNSELDKSPKGSYPLRGLRCGGCMRARGESKEFVFNVLDSNGSMLTLAASSEDQMTVWMQALCMAASGVEEVSTLSLQQGGLDCGVLLTSNRVNVLIEDMTSKSVQLVTSILVEEITEIGLDKDLPLYCVLVYEDQKAEMKGMWMLSFSSEFELGQFEQALATRWKEIYQVPIQFSEMLDPAIKTRAKRAVELFLTPRSDSITRGRTEYFL